MNIPATVITPAVAAIAIMAAANTPTDDIVRFHTAGVPKAISKKEREARNNKKAIAKASKRKNRR